MKPRKYLTRQVIRTDLTGETNELGLSVVTVEEESVKVVPFTQESEGILYVDSPICISEISKGRYKICGIEGE